MKNSKIKKAYNNFIKTLVKANNEEFGNNKLDCCKVNKEEKPKR
ncbi:MAG: LDCC motif putative metal-binding protein [Lachnospirales bacterium]